MASPQVIRVGVPGPQGPYPSSVLLASFVQPAANSNVAASVNATAWMAPGQVVFISTGGSYEVVSVTSAESVVLMNTGAPGNAVPGAEIQEGERVVVSGGGGNYVLPQATPTVLGGIKLGEGLAFNPETGRVDASSARPPRPIDLSGPAVLPEDTEVGDTFYVANEDGGEFNGVTYAGPDENGNCEGFQINSLEPLEVTPFKRASGGLEWNQVKSITLGTGGDYETLDDAYAGLVNEAGFMLIVTLVSDLPPASVLVFNQYTVVEVALNGQRVGAGSALIGGSKVLAVSGSGVTEAGVTFLQANFTLGTISIIDTLTVQPSGINNWNFTRNAESSSDLAHVVLVGEHRIHNVACGDVTLHFQTGTSCSLGNIDLAFTDNTITTAALYIEQQANVSVNGIISVTVGDASKIEAGAVVNRAGRLSFATYGQIVGDVDVDVQSLSSDPTGNIIRNSAAVYVTYATLMTMDPNLYQGQTFYVSDYGNVPVVSNGTRWLAQRPFVVAAAAPGSVLTGTTTETPMAEARVPVGILGSNSSFRVIANSLATTGGGDRQLRYRLSNTSGGITGTQMYFGAAGSTFLVVIGEYMNVASVIWGTNQTSTQFTSSSADADIFVKVTYQNSAVGTSSTLQSYYVLATPGGA